MSIMRREESLLLVVDEQVRLAPATFSREQAVANTQVLLKAAARLDVPVLASEQYPRGLGTTVPEVESLLPAGSVMEKIHFSCTEEPACAQRIDALGRKQIVLAGMEAHVCVLQTALGLRGHGYAVFVVADAVSSRRPESLVAAMERMRQGGCEIVTTEMVVFEWLHRAGTPEFKELSALIK